jgi:hypothetical protein
MQVSGGHLRTPSLVVLFVVVGLCLGGCGAYPVMERKTSPDGKIEAVVLGMSGRVDYRNVEVRDTHDPSHKAVVFRSEHTIIATTWLSNTDLVIYYEEEGATLVCASPRSYFAGPSGSLPVVLVRLRPLTGEQERSQPLE